MRVLVLGGTRSGKSARAEQLATELAAGSDRRVVYLATAPRPAPGADPEFDARIAAHADRRPDHWTTEESPALLAKLAVNPEAILLVDDLGAWLTATLDDVGGWDAGPAAADPAISTLVEALAEHRGDLVLVSPEVGMAVVPETRAGRVFADAHGSLNRRVAELCDRVELVVAGRALELTADPVPAAPVPTPAPTQAREPVPTPAAGEDATGFDTIEPPKPESLAASAARQLTLTKPPRSLGRLESIGNWIAGCQDSSPPRPLERTRVVVFAGDHGVAADGVSAYPQEVTAQMVANVVSGGAAVNVLARTAGATVRVEDIAVAVDCDPAVSGHKVRRSSGHIDREDALTHDEVRAAVAAGRAIADDEVDSGADLLIAGDLGIGNTTPATVITAVLTGGEPVTLVGRGTGIDDAGWMRKTEAVRDAMFRCRGDIRNPIELVRRAGGADIAAMAGFLAQAAQRRTPVILDGSVVTSAALIAEELAPGSRAWWQAGHRSVEPAHTAALTYLGLTPLLEMDMRLGEGTGAVAALPLVSAAVDLLRDMATFADAGVSDKQ